MNNNKKILFIDSWNNVGDFFRQERNKIKYLDNFGLYKNNSIFNKLCRFLGLKVYLPFLYFCYGDWKKKINDYDIIIIESRNTFEYLLKLIRKKYENKRIIVWYWNEVTEREMNPIYIKEKYKCEVATFDYDDAKKYNMKFNDTYFFKIDRINDKITNDVFYVGIDREGRIEKIQSLIEIFDKNNISHNICLTTSPIKKANPNYSYASRMDYKDVLKNIYSSKVILDLTKETQFGLTLRPVEALILRKKLITDNKNIKEYKFYTKDNIFILGEDDIENIKNFINKEYKEIEEKVVESYYFENWLKRLIE